MRSIIPVLFSSALILAACGPAGLNPSGLVHPTVKLDHLTLRNAGVGGGTMDVVLAVYNPNRFTIRGTRLRTQLDIEGSRFGEALLAEPFQLEDRDTTRIAVPLEFRWSGATGAVRGAVDRGAVKYRISGAAWVDAPGGTAIEVPFSGEGSVPLLRGSR